MLNFDEASVHVIQLAAKNYNCSQILLIMGLDLSGNPD
jgi:hypothetical protein